MGNKHIILSADHDWFWAKHTPIGSYHLEPPVIVLSLLLITATTNI